MKKKINLLGIIAMVAVIGFAMLGGCASAPDPAELQRQREQQRREFLESIDYKEISFAQLKSAIASVTTDRQGFKVTAYVRQPDWYVISIGNEPTLRSDGYGGIVLGAGELSGDPSNITSGIRRQLEMDRQYTVYIAVLKEDFYGRASGEYQGIVTKIDGLRSVSEVAEAREEAKRQAEVARQEQQRAEQARLANLYRQAGNNFGNFRNTSRSFSFGSGNSRRTTTYDFGDGNFIAQETHSSTGFMFNQMTGTFRVNGDTVIFLSPEGVYSFGTIVGNTLTIGGNVYR